MSVAERRNLDLESALAAALERYRERTPRSGARHEAARAVLPGGNTRSVLHYDPYPIAMARGEGARLWDLDDNLYRDFLGEYTAGLYGHSHPKLLAAVRGALDSGVVLCAPNRWEAELGAAMCERFPSCERVRFTNSGTESNLMAIGLARAATGRTHVMVFDGAYHGGVLYFGSGPSPVNAPYPVVTGAYNDLDVTGQAIEAHAGELAAILVEPMQGSGGGIVAAPEFLQGLRAAADRHGIVLIFDEVMTSRLAPGGLQAHLGVRPDLTTFGKYLGGGMSFGAFGGTARLMDRFDPARPGALPHAGTFNNNVLSMAAGLTGLREVYTAEVCAAHNAAGERLRQRINALAEAHEFPLQASGYGSIFALHPQSGPVRRAADVAGVRAGARALLHLEMMNAGFYFARRGFVSLSLPLEPADHEAFLGGLEEFMVNAGRALRA